LPGLSSRLTASGKPKHCFRFAKVNNISEITKEIKERTRAEDSKKHGNLFCL